MSAAAETAAPVDTSPHWRFYVIPGSQFAAKAMLALETQNIPYDCFHVNPVSRGAREKQLPAGGYLVPQVEIPVAGADGSYTPLKESSDILRAIDKYPHKAPGSLYPSEKVSKADEHISKVINAYTLYFNHVSREGWEQSIRKSAVSQIPLGGVLGKVLPVHAMYSPIRNSMRDSVKSDLGLEDDALNDEAMTTGLIGELERYEKALDGKHDYLFGYKYPTAADCALHAMVSRFVHGMGDSGLGPALPRLFETAGPKLERLRAWHQRMTERYPMQWSRYKKPLK